MLHGLLASLALLASPLPFPEDEEEPPTLEYATLAQAYLERTGSTGAQPGSLSLQALLDDPEHYRGFQLGLFDVRVPKSSLEERAEADLVAQGAHAIVELQRRFWEWNVDLESDAAKDDAKAFATLGKWVGSWSGYSLDALARDGEDDFLTRLGAKASVREAHARVEEIMSTGAFLGLARPAKPTTQILLVPDRLEMLETLCFTGWNHPDGRGAYWKQGVEQWTSFWDEETQVVALAYPSFPVDFEHLDRGGPMDEFEKTGAQQHTSEKAAASMFWRYYGNNDALFFEAAIAQILTVDVWDENNVRTGAPVFKSSGGSTRPFSVFVPGGNPAGGTVAGRRAVAIIDIPVWREEKAEDYWAKGLKKAMKDGQKLAKKAKDARKNDDQIHFAIEGRKQGDETYVSAPFFGPGAVDKPLPGKDYLMDYEEFFRAYRGAFFYWLRTREGGRDVEANERRFAELLKLLASRPETLSFDDAVAQVYGSPISDAALDEETPTLERRFLEWIEKGGR